jgi:hypothetical protein
MELNMEYAKRLISFQDMHPTKKIKVPVFRQLLQILLDNFESIVSTGGQTFAYVPTVNHNFFTVPLHSPYIKSWLTEHHMSVGNPPPSNQQLHEALVAFQARPTVGTGSNARCQMHLRTAWSEHYREPVLEKNESGQVTSVSHFEGPAQTAMLFSLDTRKGRHVAITPEGWSLQPARIEFVFHPTQQPLPDPEPPKQQTPEEALQPLKKLLRLTHNRHAATWTTLVAWLLHALRPAKNPSFHDYPILNLIGPPNSGKTVAAKLLTQLLDPNTIPIQSLPNTERRLHVLAAGQHILAFDNPGKINPEKSRFLSRLSTGVGSLYRHFEGMLVRPIILTSRTREETRRLGTRVVDVELPFIANLLSQGEVWEEFEKVRPQILGALLTLLAQDFNAGPATQLPNRKTKWQKLEESIPYLIGNCGGTWVGTVTELQKALNFPIHVNPLGRYLKQTESLNVTKVKNYRVVTLTLALAS